MAPNMAASPNYRREALRGLWATAKREWFSTLMTLAFAAHGFIRYGFFAGMGWLSAAFATLFALWFANEAKLGWQKAIDVLDVLDAVAKSGKANEAAGDRQGIKS